MESLLKVLKWFGLATHCFPLDALVLSDQNQLLKTLLRLVNLATQLLLLLVQIISFIEECLKSPAAVKYVAHFSGKIDMALFYGGSRLPYLIVMISSLIFRRDIIQLHDSLTVKCPRLRKLWSQSKWVIAVNVGLSLVWFFEFNGDLIRFTQRVRWNSTCDYFFIPCDEFVTKSIFAMSEVLAVLTMSYAWTWMIFYGATLVTRLNGFTSCCEALVPIGSRATEARGVNYSGDYESVIQAMFYEFQGIKDYCERYSRIGGAYALGLIVLLVVHCIGTLSYNFSYASARLDLSDPAYTYYVLTCFLSIIAILYFGDHLAQTVTF